MPDLSPLEAAFTAALLDESRPSGLIDPAVTVRLDMSSLSHDDAEGQQDG